MPKKPKFAGVEVIFLSGAGTSGLGGRRTETLWSELRIGRNEKTRAEFWRRELSQKLFDYETGGRFAPELRPVLKDVDTTPEQIAAFSADENEYLAEEFKGAIVELDDQITNAQDWQIIAYGDAFYAAVPGGSKGVRGHAETGWAARYARKANAAAKASRRGGAPVLDATSDADTLLEWLEWNDPNGEWSNIIAKRAGQYPQDDDDHEPGKLSYYEIPDPSIDELWDVINDNIEDPVRE